MLGLIAGELHGLLRAQVMIRRLKRDVLAQLPPKRRQVIRLPKPAPEDWPSGTTASEARPAAGEGGDEDEEQEPQTDGDVITAVHRTGLAKLPSAIEWLMHALGNTKGTSDQARGCHRPMLGVVALDNRSCGHRLPCWHAYLAFLVLLCRLLAVPQVKQAPSFLSSPITTTS